MSGFRIKTVYQDRFWKFHKRLFKRYLVESWLNFKMTFPNDLRYLCWIFGIPVRQAWINVIHFKIPQDRVTASKNVVSHWHNKSHNNAFCPYLKIVWHGHSARHPISANRAQVCAIGCRTVTGCARKWLISAKWLKLTTLFYTHYSQQLIPVQCSYQNLGLSSRRDNVCRSESRHPYCLL